MDKLLEELRAYLEEAKKRPKPANDNAKRPKPANDNGKKKKKKKSKDSESGGGASPFSPFKRRSILKDGLKGIVRHQTNKWKCETVGKYHYRCVSKDGEVRMVSANPGKKRAYNAKYKSWKRFGDRD